MAKPTNEVLEAKIEFMGELVQKIDTRFDKLETKFDAIIKNFSDTFATKTDLDKVDEKAKDLKVKYNRVSWYLITTLAS